MQQRWIAIYIAAVIMVVNGHIQDLRVDVIPIQSRFAEVQNVNVILKYRNTGDDIMAIYKWQLPEEGLFDPLFEVTRDGQPVEYVGPIAKRRAPTAEDIILLTPGMTVSAAIQLSTVYNMTQTGNYVVQYKMDAGQVLFTMDSALQHRMMSSNGDQEFVLQSTPVAVFVVGRRNLIIEQAVEESIQARAPTPLYRSCTSSQSSSISSAMIVAENYANNAVQFLNSMTAGRPRYTTWFGPYSAANLNQLKADMGRIQSAVSTRTLTFDCACAAGSSSTFAYVYPSQPYNIYLCGAFWPAVTTGTDSKGGTIIHELAHFTVLAGTSDHAYGQSACRSLAQSNPARALKNSDNFEYFVENNPALN
jgi:peptidyl-Lys metalloendopeptidase